MSRHLAKDDSVWNRLVFGKTHRPSLLHDDVKSDYPEEKRVQPRRKGSGHNRALSWTIRALQICLIIFLLPYLRYVLWGLSSFMKMPQSQQMLFGGHLDYGMFSELSSTRKEIISVDFPLLPENKYGVSVYSELLVNHTFNSWGHPVSYKFQPPKEIEYNKVVLTLNTTVEGVQYDRLAHLYVGGAEIWRTSTVEPGHRNVSSSHKKDVTSYLGLFKEDSEIVFQLDNLVTEKLTGAFNVVITVDFYNSDRIDSTSDELYSPANDGHLVLDEKYKLYDIRRPADKIYPLTDIRNSSTPIQHLPWEDVSVKLPKVSFNTTRLKLAVFASGNGNEEFWYHNVLDKYTDTFEASGKTLYGHGPLRFVEVYLDGQKIATQTPQPFIFTGGFSPALWSSVVPINAFDLASIDVDVTGFLPSAWDSDEHFISVKVVNALDEVEGSSSGIGNDWIISANLLAYENSEIVSSSAETLDVFGDSKAKSFGVSIPLTQSLQQVCNGVLEAGISTRLLYELKDGRTLNTTLTAFTKGEISNVQMYYDAGRSAKLVFDGESVKRIYLKDNFAEEVFLETDLSLNYPLDITYKETAVEGGQDLVVDLVNVKSTVLQINDKEVMNERESQAGTSEFHLRETGNFGEGTLHTKLKSIIDGPCHQFEYKRKVTASKGEIVSDKQSYKDI